MTGEQVPEDDDGDVIAGRFLCDIFRIDNLLESVLHIFSVFLNHEQTLFCLIYSSIRKPTAK